MIRFAIDNDLRFISHHDTVRMFERALARAGIPVRFSEGFNPRPRLSLPIPRTVGLASDDETLVVECTEAVTPDVALEKLKPQMPVGILLTGARMLEEKERVHPVRAAYRVRLDAPPSRDLIERVNQLTRQSSIEVDRTDHKTGATRRIDLRPCLLEARIDDHSIDWMQALLPGGTARVGEMLGALGLEASQWQHRVRRTAVTME